MALKRRSSAISILYSSPFMPILPKCKSNADISNKCKLVLSSGLSLLIFATFGDKLRKSSISSAFIFLISSSGLILFNQAFVLNIVTVTGFLSLSNPVTSYVPISYLSTSHSLRSTWQADNKSSKDFTLVQFSAVNIALVFVS